MSIKLSGLRKDERKRDALSELREFLDREEPSFARYMRYIWGLQAAAVTYKSLREAQTYMRSSEGAEPESFFTKLRNIWQKDYTKAVTEKVAPMWGKAAQQASVSLRIEWKVSATTRISQIGQNISGQDTALSGALKWIDEAGAAFVTNSTQDQLDAIKAALRNAVESNQSVDTLARAIRPTIGLTKQQTRAHQKYFDSMMAEGIPKETALRRAEEYAERLKNDRSYTIARTELAYAYNHGRFMEMLEMQKAGLVGESWKQWVTADDERVCPICGGLDGMKIEMEEEFQFKTTLTYPGINLTPPAHPRCRCKVIFVEKEDPGIHLEDGEIIVE